MNERQTLYVFRLGEAHDDMTPAFVVDGRDYADDEAVRADVGAARAALRERRLIADFETSAVHPEAPRTPLPSWRQWRAQHLEAGEPIGVRPRPATQSAPAGRGDMGRWLEHARAWLDAQVAAAANAVPGARVRRTREPDTHRIGTASVVLAEEQYRTDVEYLAVPPAGTGPDPVLRAVAGALHANGWTVKETQDSPGYRSLPAEQAGYTIVAVWSKRNNAVRLTGTAPVVTAATFDAAVSVGESGEPFEFVVLGEHTGGQLVPGEMTAENNRRFHRVLRYLRRGSWIIRDPFTKGPDALDPTTVASVPRGYRTDGEWIWPLALEYYLERHGVAPPEALLDVMTERAHFPPRVHADRCGQAHQALLPRMPGPFEPPGPIQFRLPPDVYDLLLTIGWTPGRQVEVEAGLDAQRSAILSEFGGLTFPVYGYGRDWRVTAFHLLPRGGPSDPARIAEAEDRLGAPLLPIGGVPDWNSEIVLHPRLGIGTAGEVERFLGRGIDEALTTLVRGVAPDAAHRAATGWLR